MGLDVKAAIAVGPVDPTSGLENLRYFHHDGHTTPVSWFALTPWSRDLKKQIQILMSDTTFFYFKVLHISIKYDHHQAFFYRILEIKVHVAYKNNNEKLC